MIIEDKKISFIKTLLQPLRFISVGAINTLIGLTIIFVAKGIWGFNDFISNLIGYSFGLLISFYLNKEWTFKHNGKISPALMRFLLAFLVSYIVNLITVYTFRDGIELNSYLAQACGIVPYTVIFYFTCRYYVFPRTPTL